MHVEKMGVYTVFWALTDQLLLFGIAAGVGALASNWLAKHLLSGMSELDFRGVVVGFMALSGAIMLWPRGTR